MSNATVVFLMIKVVLFIKVGDPITYLSQVPAV
jgi:hypothetical protein